MDNLRELSKKIRDGKLSPINLMTETLLKIENNNEINAVVSLNRTHALSEAQRLTDDIETNYRGPLHGIPITVKDSFSTKHIPTTYGMPFRYKCKKNAEVVSRLEKAGAIVIGKTNLPTMSFDWQAHHPRYGITKNPINPEYSPGGSSGGSAAAISAGLVTIEVGSDVAGSLRVPAALCGISTLRPTEGVISLDGHMAIPMSKPLENLLSAGPMARNIDDLQLIFDVISDLERPNAIPELKRITVQTIFPEVTISKSVLKAINHSIQKIKDTGIDVVEIEPSINYKESLKIWCYICGYELKKSALGYAPTQLKSLFSYLFKKRYGNHSFSKNLGIGMALSKREYMKALDRRIELMNEFGKFLQDYDLLITPVCGSEGIPICKTGTDILIDDVLVPYAEPFAIYNCATASFGHPIAVINAGKSDNGLPVGIQLHGRRYQDYQVLEHAKHLQGILENHMQKVS
ncbi:MAG: amidase [Gammaproteobacteria bacterium]|nr:amidase [Gammaproteobacteria bacterium]